MVSCSTGEYTRSRKHTNETSANVTTTKVDSLLAVCLGSVQRRTSHLEDSLICLLRRVGSSLESHLGCLGRAVDHFLKCRHVGLGGRWFLRVGGTIKYIDRGKEG